MSATWNLELLQKDDAKETEAAVQAFVQKWKENDTYLTQAPMLAEALQQLEQVEATTGTSGDKGYGLWLRHMQNENDTQVKGELQKVEEWSKKLAQSLQFFHLKLAKVSPEKQVEFLAAPELQPYKHFLERLFAESKHLLTEAEEKVMLMKSHASNGAWVQMTSGMLAKEMCSVNGKEMPFNGIFALLQSADKSVRDAAGAEIHRVNAKYAEVAEAEINALLADKEVNDELRGFMRPDQAQHLADDIETEVVDAMLQAVTERYDLAQKFYQHKAKKLGLTQFKYHERAMPLEKVEKHYSFAEACSLVHRTFAQLSPRLADQFQKFQDQGAFDVSPRPGKHGGAFCVHGTKRQPTYILLNHTGTLNDVLTLAHECGHGINNEFIRAAQNALHFGTPTSTAEVASTFMEDFVLQEIAKELAAPERQNLLFKRLEDDVGSIFRQVACYKFEQELHAVHKEKGYVSKEVIGELFQKHMAAYMGPAVEQSAGSQNWWVYWSHIRRFFYVYSYASGLLISKALQNKVRKDPQFIQKVEEFLAAGSSASPKEIFAKCGIDLTDPEFWRAGLAEVEACLAQLE